MVKSMYVYDMPPYSLPFMRAMTDAAHKINGGFDAHSACHVAGWQFGYHELLGYNLLTVWYYPNERDDIEELLFAELRNRHYALAHYEERRDKYGFIEVTYFVTSYLRPRNQ